MGEDDRKDIPPRDRFVVKETEEVDAKIQDAGSIEEEGNEHSQLTSTESYGDVDESMKKSNMKSMTTLLCHTKSKSDFSAGGNLDAFLELKGEFRVHPCLNPSHSCPSGLASIGTTTEHSPQTTTDHCVKEADICSTSLFGNVIKELNFSYSTENRKYLTFTTNLLTRKKEEKSSFEGCNETRTLTFSNEMPLEKPQGATWPATDYKLLVVTAEGATKHVSSYYTDDRLSDPTFEIRDCHSDFVTKECTTHDKRRPIDNITSGIVLETEGHNNVNATLTKQARRSQDVQRVTRRRYEKLVSDTNTNYYDSQSAGESAYEEEEDEDFEVYYFGQVNAKLNRIRRKRTFVYIGLNIVLTWSFVQLVFLLLLFFYACLCVCSFKQIFNGPRKCLPNPP